MSFSFKDTLYNVEYTTKLLDIVYSPDFNLPTLGQPVSALSWTFTSTDDSLTPSCKPMILPNGIWNSQ